MMDAPNEVRRECGPWLLDRIDESALVRAIVIHSATSAH